MIGIVTVNWHAYEVTVKLVSQLLHGSVQDFALVIVNNSPEDKDLFEQDQVMLDPRITVIETGSNLGYSGGLNRGIKTLLANPEIDEFLLMNNDLEIDPDFIEKMMNEGRNRKTIYSPVILLRDTQLVQNTGGVVFLWLGGAINLNKNRPIGKMHKIVPGFLSGTILFMHRQVVESIGFFDEIYGSYWEDVDFCYRARKQGMNIEILWNISARHFHSYSTRGNSKYKAYLLERNQILFARKHLNFFLRSFFILASISRGFMEALIRGNLKDFFQGVAEGFQC